MSVRPWNGKQLCRPNVRYGDQEHFYWYTEAGQTIPAGRVFTTSLSSTDSTSASCGRRRLSLKDVAATKDELSAMPLPSFLLSGDVKSLKLLIAPGDRIALEGDNQKQTDS